MERIIFKYLNSKSFEIIKKKYYPSLATKTIVGTYYHFVSPGNDTSDMRYSSYDGRLFISSELLYDVMDMFSMDEDDALIYISEWVEEEINKEIDIENVSYFSKNSLFGWDVFELED